MLKKANILFFLGLVIPLVFVFRAFWGNSPLVWGDAPYFYPEGLEKLTAEPYIWVNRGYNFGWINDKLWLHPLMLFYGAWHQFFGLGNDAIVRIIFYFPSLILSLIGPILFARFLGYGKIVQFFVSLLYTLNTYFLLVVDGGQVGVALAYGLFPLSLLYLIKLVDKPNFWSFFQAQVLLLFILVADVRVAAIAIITLFLWLGVWFTAGKKIEPGKVIKHLFPLLATAGLFTAYWFFPTAKLGFSAINLPTTPLPLVSLLNAVFLFQPHWPENIFGKIAAPPFYFALVPVLVFAGFLIKRQKKDLVFGLLFLVFAFLVKGAAEPLGQLYSLIVNNIGFGLAFRDSSKFFIPLLLFGGILVGRTVDTLRGRWVPVLVWAYLLFLIYPAISGRLNGVLAGRPQALDFAILHEKLQAQPGFFRTAWFPDRHPFTFQTEEKPALDAKALIETRPIASLNVGTFDAFNFLHNPDFLEWFDLLGIKYLVFSGDARKPEPNEEEKQDWGKLLALTDGVAGLKKLDWGTSFPVYQTPRTKPRIFAVDKVVAVVGGEDIYERIRGVAPDFSVGNQGFVFFEDGKLDPQLLRGLEKDAAILVFNEKDNLDLQMSFLQKYFVSVADASKNEWALRKATDYLKWKYEFLVNGVKTLEFDFAKGIAFSTVRGETISWDLNVPASGDYILAVRTLQEGGLPAGRQGFGWDISAITLGKGVYPVTLTNDTGFSAVNVVALIPQKDWQEGEELVRQFTGHFKVVRDIASLANSLSGSSWSEVGYDKLSPVRYKIVPPAETAWIILNENYHPFWKMETGPDLRGSLPIYSAVNGFYLSPHWRDPELVFTGQKYVRWGIYYTGLTLFLLAIAFFWFYPKSHGR